MAEHHYHETREVRPASSGKSTGTIAFIVGGLVVAVGLIFFWIFGGADMDTATPGGADIEINATADSAAGAASDDGVDTGAAATANSADTGAAEGAAAESDAAATVGADSN